MGWRSRNSMVPVPVLETIIEKRGDPIASTAIVSW
jgi:hypothetical protein